MPISSRQYCRHFADNLPTTPTSSRQIADNADFRSAKLKKTSDLSAAVIKLLSNPSQRTTDDSSGGHQVVDIHTFIPNARSVAATVMLEGNVFIFIVPTLNGRCWRFHSFDAAAVDRIS